jgi:hypothetical protein
MASSCGADTPVRAWPRPGLRLLESARAVLARARWLAGVRGLFDHPGILVHDSSLCGTVAQAATVGIPGAGSGVDCDVGDRGAGDAALAARFVLLDSMGMDSGRITVRWRFFSLFKVGQEFQRGAIGRAARSPRRPSRSEAGDRRHSRTRAAPGVFGASLRDAWLERGHGPRRLLGVDGVCGGNGRGDDPDGGCGAGEEVWGLLSSVSQRGTSGSAAAVRGSPDIIRLADS